MLAVALDPVQSQSVKEGRKTFHNAENGDGQNEPEGEAEEGEDDTSNAGAPKRLADGHAPQDLAELCMRQGQGPQAQIRGGVGNTAEAELNGVNHLVDHNFAEIMTLVLLLFVTDNQ